MPIHTFGCSPIHTLIDEEGMNNATKRASNMVSLHQRIEPFTEAVTPGVGQGQHGHLTEEVPWAD
jgi:hypothetical protein